MADKKPPPTGLGILVDEKRVNDLLTQKTGAKAMLRSGCNLLLFVSFLLLFTGLALSEPLSDHRAFEGFLRRRFDTSAAMPLREVESIESFWRYIDRSFMPAIYGNDTRRFYFPGHQVARLLQIDGANRLLGVARLRMLKIRPGGGCSISSDLAGYFPTCYGPFSAEALDRVAFGPPNDQTGDPVFFYNPDSTGSQAVGKFGSYPPGGFMEAFTADHNATTKIVNRMIDNDFVGAGTRAIVLDWSVYNFNLGCYAVCRLLFEVAPSGLWAQSFDIDVLMRRHLSPLGGKTSGDWLALLGEVVLVLFVLRYLLEECSEFIGFRGWSPYIKFDYFADAWNLLDWLNLVLMIVTLVFRIMTWGLASGASIYIGDPSRQGVDTFTDLNGVAMNVRAIHEIIAFNTVLTWFKAVKYISVLPYITTFMQTVSKSQTALITFMVFFSTLLFGFVLAYSVAFGELVAVFRTPFTTFVFLTRSFLGNADFSIVYNSAPIIGSFLIMMYVMLIFFVCVNLFYAIMIRALADVKEDEAFSKGKQWDATKDKAIEFWNTISSQFHLEERFRSFLPGLYGRIQLSKKNAAEKEEERDAEVLKRERSRRPDASEALGPGNPSLGRRPPRAANKVSADDLDESDAESEVDLGPLRDKKQLSKRGMFGDAWDPDAEPQEDLLDDDAPVLMDDEEDGEPPPQAIELMVEATQHVVDGITDRTLRARGVLLGEMDESKEVLMKVGSVLEVLSRRARDLEAQQRSLLKAF